MNGPITIGIDHGYAAMKTAHSSFPSGIVEYAHEPYTMENVLEYEGQYYVVGTGRQPLQKDKTLSENYFLLTLAAIAKELTFREADANATVILAAGLPLTSFGRDKQAFRKYLLRKGEPILFRYEQKSYSITIADVVLFPQGYSAVLTQPELLREPSVIVADIGGWTVDLMRIDHGVPDAGTCKSLELGMIRCLGSAAERIRQELGISMSDVQLEYAMTGNAGSMDPRGEEIINAVADEYVETIISAITESGLDPRAMPLIVMGGGANLFKRHVPPRVAFCRLFILDDTSLNAKGFERLSSRVSAECANG